VRLRGAIVAAALIGALLSPSAVTRADTAQVITLAATFLSPVTLIQPGDTLVLNNQDILPHNLVSTTGLFASPTINRGATAEVAGASSLPAGQYPFTCTLHPWMLGVLVVQGFVDVPVLPGGGVPTVSPPSLTALGGGVVPTPTSVTRSGPFLYVTSWALGALYRVPILTGGLLGRSQLVATGFTNPLGVVVDGATGIAYVSDSHPSTTPGRATDGRVWAVSPTGAIDVVIDGLPNGRHNTNGMAIHNGRLYITNGNSTDDGVAGGEPEVAPYSGSLLSVPLTGRALSPVDAMVHATGMRNVYDVAFRPGTSEAWITMNGPDALEPFGEDLLLKTNVTADPADFGFPACIYRAGPGGPTDPLAGDNPVVGGECGAHDPPELTLGLHVSANGVAFGPNTPAWGDDLYIAEFGNFFGQPAGRKIVRVPIDAGGNAGAPTDVFVGAGPLDLTFGPAGLYVADFLAGTVTLVRPASAGLLSNIPALLRR
jgi:plastocyanin